MFGGIDSAVSNLVFTFEENKMKFEKSKINITEGNYLQIADRFYFM